MFLNLRSVVYNVDNMQKAIKWYGKLLNTEPETAGPKFTSFSIGGDRLGLNLIDKLGQKTSSGAIAYLSMKNCKETQRMNDQLEKEIILVETICQTLPDPVFIIDEEGTYIEVFGGNERVLYDSGSYLKRKKLFDLLPRDIADRFITTVKKAIDTNALQIIEYELTSTDISFNPLDGPTNTQWYEGRVTPLSIPTERKAFVLWVSINITEKKNAQIKLARKNRDLKHALDEINVLRGIIPICSHCKKIRDDRGYWNQIEAYIQEHSEVDFSHGICPECVVK